MFGDIVASSDGVGGVRTDDSDETESPEGEIDGSPVGELGDVGALGS